MATVTINSIEYTVYADVAAADDYFNASVNFADWDVLTDDAKSRSLVSSTRILERQQWQGNKTDEDQDLKFPRSGLTDCSGNAVDEDAIPQEVIDASMLLALDLATGEDVDTKTTENLQKRLKADTVEIEYFRASQDNVQRFPKDVMELIGCFLSGSAQIAGSLSYGTDGVPADTDFSLNDGI